MNGLDAPGISWDWGNEVLYRICREEPRHTDPDIIAAKLWLIGRSYAAQIERGSGQQSKSDQLYATVAHRLKASDVDRWIGETAKIQWVDDVNVPMIISTHFRFMKLIQESTGGLQRRSFASKYLHFHSPHAFFIYDSYSSSEIRKRVGRFRVPALGNQTEKDTEYADFVFRCLKYRDKDGIRSHLSPRQLDNELLAHSSVAALAGNT